PIYALGLAALAIAAPDPCAKFDIPVVRTINGIEYSNYCSELCVPSGERDVKKIQKLCSDTEIGNVKTLCSSFTQCRFPKLTTPAPKDIKALDQGTGHTYVIVIAIEATIIVITLIALSVVTYKYYINKDLTYEIKHTLVNGEQTENPAYTSVETLVQTDTVESIDEGTQTEPNIAQPQDNESDKIHANGKNVDLEEV
ncbi:unnamed protein product, partial [Owenia fusiformis]